MTEQQMKWIVAAVLVGLLLLLGIILVTYIQYRILRAAVKNGMIAGYEELAARRARQKIDEMCQDRVFRTPESTAEKLSARSRSGSTARKNQPRKVVDDFDTPKSRTKKANR